MKGPSPRTTTASNGALNDGGPGLSAVAGGGQRLAVALDDVPGPPEACILDTWRRYILHGEEPEISGRANLATLAMVDAAITSSREGCVVALGAG